MYGTYDRTYSRFNSSSQAFQRAQQRISRLKEYRITINALNLKYLYQTVDLPKKTSNAIRITLCPICSEDRESCEENRDAKRRYRCKVLSRAEGKNIRLYLPSFNDRDVMKERLKKGIMQIVVRDPGITQNQIAKRIRANKMMVRECLNELVRRGVLQCSERNEQGRVTKRYVLIFD